MKNPFSEKKSPIESLYLRSRSKSQQIKLSSLSRSSSSYREYQIKIIRQALRNNHIIEKEYRGQQKRVMRRQRLQSKYFGIQSQRYKSPSFHQQKKSTNGPYFQKQNISHLITVNLLPPYSHPEDTQMYRNQNNLQVPNHRSATYESTECITNHVVPSENRFNGDMVVSSKKLISKKSVEKQEKKCSITCQLSEAELGGFKNSRFQKQKQRKNIINKVRQEYYQQMAESIGKRSEEELASTYYS